MRCHIPRVSVVGIPVAAPLPHIAGHIIQPQFVRHQPAHYVGRITAIKLCPRHMHQIIRSCIRCALRLRTPSGSILPLRLRRQTKRQPRQLPQPRDKGLHLIETHLLHRQLVAHKVRRVIAHHSLPQRLRHLIAPHIETAHRHTVSRHLVVLAPLLAVQHRRTLVYAIKESI